MQQGLLISCLDAPDLFEAVRVAHQIGYRNCEISVCPGDKRPNLVDLTPAQRREVMTLASDLGMTVSSVQCHLHNGYGDAGAATRAEAVDHTRRMMDLCASLEIPILHTVSGVAEDSAPHAEQLDRVAECYRRILEPAGGDGPIVAIEPVFIYIVGNLAHTRALYERLGDLGLTINFDPSHFPYHDESCIPFIEEYAGKIVHAHSKDAVVEAGVGQGSKDVFPMPDGKRTFRFAPPGQGVLEWDEIIAALEAAGFAGVLSLEMGHGFPGPPLRDARNTYEFFRGNYGLE